MKLRQITISALIILTILPVKAYEYFTIHFKDGTKSEAFYAVDIDSMRYSKISVDSIEYNEWKVQEIYTRSNVYRYALEGIEKIEFKDVDESVVADNIAKVSSFVAPYFATCESTDELSQYLPEILSTEGVEKAWVDNLTLFIKIVDFGIIQFSYNPKRPAKSSTDISLANSRTRSLEYKATSNPNQNAQVYFPDEKPKNMCIINQVYQDYDFKDDTYTKEILQNTYKNFGIQTDIINEPSPDFFYKDIFDYDLVFIDTHGSYDGTSHWLMSGDKLWESLFTKKDDRDSLIKKWVPDSISIATAIIKFMRLYHNYHVTPNILSFSYIVERHNENSDRYNLVAYTDVSEEFIHMSPYKFKNGSIIFCTACESMKGNGRKNSDCSLANIFVQRGASCFFGYDNINTVGGEAGYYFFNYLINGKSLGATLGEMQNNFSYCLREIIENNGETDTADLRYYSTDDSVKKVRIIRPHTEDAQFEFVNDSISVKLIGKIVLGDNHFKYDFKKNNEYDFLISDNPQMTDPDSLSNIQLSLEDEMPVTYKWEGVLKEFKKTPFKPGKKYYYCARLKDGYDSCTGEIKEIETDSVYTTIDIRFKSLKLRKDRDYYIKYNFPEDQDVEFLGIYFNKDSVEVDSTSYSESICYSSKFPNDSATVHVVWKGNLEVLGSPFNAGGGSAKIIIPSNIKKTNWTFSNFNHLYKWGDFTVILPEGFKEVGVGTFEGCLGLKDLILPSTTEVVDFRAFADCDINKLDLPKNLKKIGMNAFKGSNIATLELPESIEYLSTASLSNNKLTSILLNCYNAEFEVKGYTSAFGECENLTTATFNGDWQKLPNYLFSNCRNLTTVKLPNSIKEIGYYCFSDEYFKVGCPIKNIDLPKNLKIIRASAFAGTKLETIKLPDCLETIDDAAFKDTNLSEIELPESLVYIGAEAFANTKIKTVSLPANIKSVGGFPNTVETFYLYSPTIVQYIYSGPIYYVPASLIEEYKRIYQDVDFYPLP